MCGRIACALGIDDLSCATACKSKNNDVYIKTRAHKSAKESKPSYNVPPTCTVPVVVSSEHKCFEEANETSARLLVSMRFGIIPPWLKPTDVISYRHETHLCKIERMRESKLYKPLYEKGFRCVIPCVGYYEWQSTKSLTRQPYFFYNKENVPEDLINDSGSFDPESGWSGVHLLYLAGLFSIYVNSEGKKVYSFAIITRETNEEWNWVHHRMPVVLQSSDDVNNWIKCNSSESAFEILNNPITNLNAHPVNKTIVNSTKNTMSTCILPIDSIKPVNTFMSSWLEKSLTKTNTELKKPKNETGNKNKKRTSLDTWLSSAQKKPKKD